jgi:hypothetical protein
LIKNKDLKNRGNSDLNVEATPLTHVKVEIEHGQGSRSGLGLDVEREDQIRNKELKNRGNSNLRIESKFRMRVGIKVKCQEGKSD